MDNTNENKNGVQKAINTLGWAGAGLAAALLGARVLKTVLRQSRAIDLGQKVVLITGGSRGLGLVLARQLAKENAKLVLCARDAQELRDAKANLLQSVPSAKPQNIVTFPFDVTDKDSACGAVRFAEETFGPVDVLINNAGTIGVGPLETMTDDDFDESLQTHFWGPYFMVGAVLPSMQARRFGRIVNVSSIGGKIAVPHMVPYSTGKFALVGFSEGLRAEVAKDNVFVTTVCPGLLRTGSPKNATFKGQNEKEYAWFTVSDSLPGVSQSAEACATAIINALRHGEPEIVTTLPAQIGAAFHGVFPGATSEIMALVNRALPSANGPNSIGTQKRTGSESVSPLAPPVLTALSDTAAARNNE